MHFYTYLLTAASFAVLYRAGCGEKLGVYEGVSSSEIANFLKVGSGDKIQNHTAPWYCSAACV